MLRYRILLMCLLFSALTILAVAAESEPAKDPQGDPLPAGAVARLGTVRWRHDDRVVFASFLPDGKSVVSAGDDLTIRVWEYPSGKQVRRIDLSADEKQPVDRDAVKHLRAVALSPDGKTIATYLVANRIQFGEPAIRIHDLSTGKELPGLPVDKELGVVAVSFSPGGEQLAALNPRGRVRIWNWAKKVEQNSFEFHDDNTGANGNDLIYAPDGKTLATLNDNFVILWDPSTGKKKRSFTLNTKTSRVYDAAFSPDGKTFAFSSYDSTITVVETNSDKEIRNLSQEKLSAQALLFSKDASKLYARSFKTRERQILQEWDVTTGKLLREFGIGPQLETGLFRGGLSLSPNGKTLLVAGFRQTPQFIDLATGKEIEVIRGQAAALEMLQYTPDSKSIVAMGADAAAWIWDAGTGKDGRMLNEPEQRVYAVSADGKTLAVQLPNSTDSITLIDAATGKAIGEIKLKERETALRVLFAPNGKVLAVRKYMEQKLDLYDVPTAKLLHALDIKSGAPQPKSGMGKGSRTSAPAAPTLLFSADSQRLAAYSDAKTLSLWDVATGQQVGSLVLSEGKPVQRDGRGGALRAAGSPVQSGAFTPDGRCLAVDRNDGVVTIYELVTAQPRCTYGPKPGVPDNADRKFGAFEIPYAKMPGTHVAFSPNGKFLVHAGQDRAVHVFDLFTGKELAAFKGHGGALNAVAFAPNGQTIVSSGVDTTALVWDVSKVPAAAAPGKALTADELKARWGNLAENDAVKAFTAIAELTASPKEAVAFLKEHIKPAAALDVKRVQELIAKLDNDQPTVRQKATEDLSELDEQLVPVLDQTLATNPAFEVRKRLEEVRKRLTDPLLTGDTLRRYRAVEVLERIGTPDARALLQTLAEGAPAALLTKNAKAALKR